MEIEIRLLEKSSGDAGELLALLDSAHRVELTTTPGAVLLRVVGPGLEQIASRAESLGFPVTVVDPNSVATLVGRHQ